MAIAEQQVTVGICDLCGARRHGTPGGAGPDGYAGKVTSTADGEAARRLAGS